MTNLFKTSLFSQIKHVGSKQNIALALFALSTLVSVSALSDPLPVLATEPLSATAEVVKPNLMFVFDTSKSMQSDLANDAIGIRNDSNNYVANANQCKSGAKGSGPSFGAITAATRGGTVKFPLNPNTRLTIWPGAGRSVGHRLYITFPGNASFSGIYTVKKVNVTGATYTPTVTTCNGYNTSVINNENGVSCQGFVAAKAGNPSADPPIAPNAGCQCTGIKPANQSTNFSTNITYTGTGTTTSCRWFDPKDTQSAIGTICSGTTTTGGVLISAASDDGFEIDVVNAGTSGPFSVDQRKDAQLTWANQDTNSCLPGEPPLAAAKVQTLFYDPTVSYYPPPSPAKIAVGSTYPNNLLDSMTSGYTAAWTKVPKDGTKLSAAGLATAPASLAAADRVSLFALTDVVWCDTRQRPVRKDPSNTSNAASNIFTTDKEWFESNRCRRNTLGVNTVAKSPNYPYVYPAKTDGGLATPSQTSFLNTTTVDFQVGQSKTGKNPVYDTFNSPANPTPSPIDNPNAFYVFAQIFQVHCL